MKRFRNRLVAIFLGILGPVMLQGQSFDLKQEQGQLKMIDPGASHEYKVALEGDDLLFVRFMQAGSDIEIEVLDPKGEILETFDGNNGKEGPELVHLFPRESGNYTLRVKPLEEQKKPGQYGVQIDNWIDRRGGPTSVLDHMISYWAEQEYLPGFAVAVLEKDMILFQKAYGYSDVQAKKPYELRTLQNIGSVSKTLIGISLMKALEDGKIDLQDDINEYLPFSVVNPYFPEAKISIQSLANHTSSIAEMPAYEKSYILLEPFSYEKGEVSKREYKEMTFYQQNEEMPMGEFLKSLLAKGGDLYAKKNFYKQAPGEKYAYSNAGATLAAYIIEQAYDMPYHAFTQTYILDALEMEDSGWSFEKIEAARHSDLHFVNQKRIPRYSLITYPDGGLLTNIRDLSKFLQSQMRGFYGAKEILSADAYQYMMSPKLNETQQRSPKRNYGIFWEFTGKDIGHNGGDPGAVCFIRFDPETGIGRIIMTNILPNSAMAGKAFSSIWRFLNEMGPEIQAELAAD